MNELIFFIETVLALSGVLVAFRLGRSWLAAYVAASVVMMNIFATKGIDMFGIAVTGGNALYGSIFLATDLLSEHYGKKDAQRVVMIGFFISVFFVIMSQCVLWYVPNEFDFAHGAMATLFSLTPRIVFASMLSYLITQHLDIYIFEKIRQKTNGKHLWLRNNGSTMISQLLDAVIFNTIAFAGIFPLGGLILFTYLIKIMVAIVDTPFMYLANKIKPQELL